MMSKSRCKVKRESKSKMQKQVNMKMTAIKRATERVINNIKRLGQNK